MHHHRDASEKAALIETKVRSMQCQSGQYVYSVYPDDPEADHPYAAKRGGALEGKIN